MQNNWSVSCDVDEDGLCKNGIMSVRDGSRAQPYCIQLCPSFAPECAPLYPTVSNCAPTMPKCALLYPNCAPLYPNCAQLYYPKTGGFGLAQCSGKNKVGKRRRRSPCLAFVIAMAGDDNVVDLPTQLICISDFYVNRQIKRTKKGNFLKTISCQLYYWMVITY